MIAEVDKYLVDGCGRCKYGGTPDCKVNTWQEALIHLRAIVLSGGLAETLKWGMPCYTYKKSNILMIAAFKEYCSFTFFKGVLLQDAHNILEKPGENSQTARVIRFTNTRSIQELEAMLKTYIYEAIEVEKAGLKVSLKKVDDYEVPEELTQKFNAYPALRAAFEALTPGRRRSYLLHFSAAKQSQTRTARIEKCMQQIFEGKGFNEY